MFDLGVGILIMLDTLHCFFHGLQLEVKLVGVGETDEHTNELSVLSRVNGQQLILSKAGTRQDRFLS